MNQRGDTPSEVRSKEAIVHNLGYEWWMFRGAIAALAGMDDDPDSFLRNALVEAVVAHGRVLVDFFFERPHSKLRSGDWASDDLGIPRLPVEAGSLVAVWSEEASKRVMHMSNRRAGPAQGWRAHELEGELDKRMTLVIRNEPGLFQSDWLGYRDFGEDRYQRSMGVGGGGMDSVGPTGPSWPGVG